MKIFFIGGGSGGHFFPLIAVAEAINDLVVEEHFVSPKLYYFSSTPFSKSELYKANIKYIYCPSGKRRIGSDIKTKILNFFDLFKIFFGFFVAMFTLTKYYPDVIFSKGGYCAFPGLLAAKILKIPVVIHDSDSIPGRVSLWSAKFAKKIAISYPEAEYYFTDKQKKKIALTGNPIRKEMLKREVKDSFDKMDLDPYTPVVFVIGGSVGSKFVNENILDVLPKLIEKYQVIHQTGSKNFHDVLIQTNGMLRESPFKNRYRPFPTLNSYFMRVAMSVAKVIITRAGSVLFEISVWEKPSIVIPLPQSISRDQKLNAYAYSRLTGAIVIEQRNLKPSILLSEINTLMNNTNKYNDIVRNIRQSIRPSASKTIARELLNISIKHT